MAPSSVESSVKFERMLRWNGKIPLAVDNLVHILIQAKVAQHPESQAICSWDGNLTYAELDDYSNRLASYLSNQGVGPEKIIPVCFEKSLWTIVSAVAVLKAGGAFLLMDTSQPLDRLKSIIEQTGASFAFSSRAFIGQCRELVDKVFAVDASSVSSLNIGPLSSTVRPNNAAYYIFTSGSTGSPKGVVIEHSQLSTTATHCGKRMGYAGMPRVFQFASYAFDMCITDIFATLVHGGTVCVPSDWERNNAIVDAMRRMEVTSARFTPSLVSNLTLEDVPTLSTLILGGESCPASLIHLWAPKLRLILAYGPTEGCVVCIFSEASDHKPAPGEIGRPVTCRAWIVKQDNYNVLAEIGEAGELLIEGPNVARDYLNDKEKTNRQFIRNLNWMPATNVNSSKTQDRIYRTGDLAKYLEDGTLCWLGRIDNQVKIRGQRLELEEVEKKLHDCLNRLGVEAKHVVVEAVMLSGMKSKQLLAFLCLNTSSSLGYLDWESRESDGPTVQTEENAQKRFQIIVSKIEEAMRAVLPSYAIPSLWVPLRAVPLTVSRKQDRNRLRIMIARFSAKQLSFFFNPTFFYSSSGSSTIFSDGDRKFQALWATVFGVDPSTIELNDNFFSIGGDSVLAIKLAAAARSIGLDLSLQIIFNHPVLSDMSNITQQLTVLDDDLSIIPPFALLNSSWDFDLVRQEASNQCSVDYDSIEDIYPCSPMQEGLIALSAKDPGTYVLKFVYHLPENVDLERLRAAWETVSKTTAVLRTRFIIYNLELLQVVLDQPIEWDIVDADLATFLHTEKDEQPNLGRQMSRHKVLRQPSSGKLILVWTIHHALVDGWAESNITTSVEEQYRGISSPTSKIPQFNMFIKDIVQQDKVAAQEFWRKQLANASPATFPPLPDSTYIPKVKRSNRISHLTLEEGAELQHKINFVKRGSATVATMIQAAWFILVGIYSNSSDIITGVTLNGRTAQLPGIDLIPGPTITTVPFRARLLPDQNVLDYLKSIQDQYLRMLPYAQFGLQNIRRLSEDAVSACKFRSLLLVQAANKSLDSRNLLLERSYAFPVMDFAIVMECEITKEGIDIRATFDHLVLSQAQVQRMFRQMEDILHIIMLSTTFTRVSDLQKISEVDMSQVLKWNRIISTPKTNEACIHDLIERNSIDRGDEPAICAWDGEITYSTLDKYASGLAAHLQLHYQVKPETSVGISFGKSVWAVVSMLAVLKAGAVCLPVDPNSSGKTLRAMVESLARKAPTVLLTSKSHKEKLRQSIPEVLSIDEQTIHKLVNTHALRSKVTPNNTAFIIFKSGSLDMLRAVALEHQEFRIRLLTWSGAIQRNRESRVLQFAGYTSHIGLGDIFSTLISGGCICIPRDGTRNLVDEINVLKVNELSLTPSVASCFRPVNVPGVRVLVTTGEPITKVVIESWSGNLNVINMYGLAETLGYCIGRAGIRLGDNHNNIGRGIGILPWIVDPGDPDILIPIGGIGELVVEASELAHSNLGTALGRGSHLLKHPTWSQSGQASSHRRFYRTGDFVSYNTDGSLTLVGHHRDYVEIEGRRVDLAEVECQLQEIVPTSVRAAVIFVPPSQGDKSTLVAFLGSGFETEEDTPCSLLVEPGKELKELCRLIDGAESKLASVLPRYMIPSAFIPIHSVPITASGKVNRRRLQYLATTLSPVRLLGLRSNTTATNSKQPLTEMERRVYDLWKSLLETDDISVDDNFFQLGGGSVLAMRLVSMARRDGLVMTVSGIFSTPTLRELALTVHKNVDKADIAPFALLAGTTIAHLQRQAALQCGIDIENIEDIYPCSHFQLHYVIGYSEASSDPTKDPWHWQSQVVYSIPPSLDLERFKAVWNLAINRHPILRTRLIYTPSEIFQVVVKESEYFPWNEETNIHRYIETDRTTYMTFGDRLLRLGIVEVLGTGERFFVFTAQHVIYDAFMRDMLFNEVEAAYFDAFAETRLPKMNQFIEYITRTDKSAAIKFWTAYLADVATKSLLVEPQDSGILNITEKMMVTQNVKTLGGDLIGVTLPTIIEVASALAIAHTVNCDDVIFYSDRSGRNLPVEGIQDLIGPTTLFLPTRVHIDPKQAVHDLLLELQRMKSTSLPHEHLGFLELREMGHLKQTLRNALNINISPHSHPSVGRNWGLVFKSSHLTLCDDPFGINVDLYDDRIEWLVYFDDRFIDAVRVERLMEDMKSVFFRLVSGNAEPSVGEILDLLSSNSWRQLHT